MFDKYEVDEDGLVWNKRTNRIRKAKLDKGGYLRVMLYDKFLKRHNVLVHRLVADKYVKKVEGKTFVNHIDGNKTNNSYKNLEWCSIAENNWHKRNILRKKNGSEKKPVRCVETGETYGSIFEATLAKGLNKGDISHAIKGTVHKTAGGYHWSLLEGENDGR